MSFVERVRGLLALSAMSSLVVRSVGAILRAPQVRVLRANRTGRAMNPRDSDFLDVTNWHDEPPRKPLAVPLVLLCFLVVAGIGLYWWTHR